MNFKLTRDALPAAKIRKDGFQKVFNVWTKSHFSNFEDVFLVTKMSVGGS